ncbi:MAG: PAS domain-containing protein [Desulfobulbaceae bacterium]|nr:PAS domain-containing protein [Desulfobulbaceae bacterium]
MEQNKTAISVKNKAIFLVSFFVVLLCVLFFIQGRRLHGEAIDRILEQRCDSADLIINSIGEYSYGPFKKRIVNMLENNDEIVKAFAARNRDMLYQVALPKYQALQHENSEFYVMHFHLPDGTTFLRIHWPDFHGDDLKQVRPIVQAVHQRQVQLSAYEIGRRGIFYRIVQPVFDDAGTYVGALEFGINIDYQFEAIRRQTNAKVALYVDAERWDKANSSSHDDFHQVGDYMVHGEDSEIFDLLPAGYNFSESGSIIQTKKDISYLIHSHDYLKNFMGHEIGGILLLHDISQILEEKAVFIRNFLIFSLFLLTFTILTLWFSFESLIGRLESSKFHLKKVVAKLRDENLAREHVENALLENEKKSHDLLENITHGIVLVNADYIISKVNSAIGRMCGKDEYDFLGKFCYQELRQRTSVCPDCPGKLAMETGNSHTIRWSREKKNEGELIVKKTAFPLPVKNNKPTGFVLILEDLTEQQQAEKSLYKFKHIVDASQDHLSFVSSNYVLDLVNKAYLCAHKKEFEEVAGRSMAEIYGDKVFFQSAKKHIDSALAGSLVRCQYWYEYPDLGLRYMDEVYSPYVQEDGEVRGIVISSRDITRQKMVESQLRKYENIVSASRDHMSFVDRDYVYKAVNDAYLRDSQKSREEIVGHSVASLLGEDIFETTVKSKIDQALQGKDIHYEEWFFFPRIGWSCREVHYYPFYDDNRMVSGLVVNSRDITERKEMERSIQQMQKKEALATLASGIAHDFNNILGAIIGCTEMSLLDMPQDDNSFKHILQANKAAYRARNLVKRILSFSRQKEGTLKDIKLIPLINETLDMVRVTLPPTVETRVFIETDKDVMVGDESAIQQMILNLFTNAAQAIGEKEGLLLVGLARVAAGDIEINEKKKKGPYLCLTVSDTGCGIEPNLWDRIFDPYFSNKGVSEGTGLGLAIVQNIVKNHGGMLTFDSMSGKGTTMKVFLPCHNERILLEKGVEAGYDKDLYDI